MSCNITAGIPRGCRDNAGGVFQFYIATYPTTLTVADEGTDDTITSIISGSAAGSEVEYYPYIPNKNSSDFTETYQVSIENGTVGYEQKATMIFSKMEASKANQIKMMATGNLTLVVKDKNGNYFLMGEDDGVVLSGGNAGTGKALTDLNGYNLELTAMEGNNANQIASGSINIDATSGILTVAV